MPVPRSRFPAHVSSQPFTIDRVGTCFSDMATHLALSRPKRLRWTMLLKDQRRVRVGLKAQRSKPGFIQVHDRFEIEFSGEYVRHGMRHDRCAGWWTCWNQEQGSKRRNKMALGIANTRASVSAQGVKLSLITVPVISAHMWH